SVVNVIQGFPGVLRIFRGDQLRPPQATKDPLERAASLSYFPGRSGDLVIVPKPNWILGTTAATTHGSANEYDQRVPVMLMGAGVKPGSYQQAASPADVAPTLAAICGIAMPKAQGPVLPEPLRVRKGRPFRADASSTWMTSAGEVVGRLHGRRSKPTSRQPPP